MTLADINPEQRGIPYANWMAEQLNRMFLDQGLMRQLARITAATVAHGMTKEKKWAPNAQTAPTTFFGKEKEEAQFR